jgi:hypothetical protein
MKKGEKKSLKKENINYKKLFFELMIILAILFVTTLIVLLPILEKHGALEKNIYGEYAGLIKEVDDYDYSKGRNRELESKIEEVWNKGTINKRFYFYGLARAVYFCNIGYYNTANETFSEIKLVVPESENDELEFDLDARAVLCERKQNEN